MSFEIQEENNKRKNVKYHDFYNNRKNDNIFSSPRSYIIQ